MTISSDLIGAVISDAMELLCLSGGSVAGALVTRYLRRRAEAARELLLEELRQAKITKAQAASEDDAVAVVIRYLRAAQEGAARLNLRLLAKAIAGQLQTDRLRADEFLQCADALASLSRDEVVVIAALYRAWDERKRDQSGNLDILATPWKTAQRQLVQAGMDSDLVHAVATMTQRTGLVFIGGTFDDQGEFKVSPILAELGKTVDFQDALCREGIRSP